MGGYSPPYPLCVTGHAKGRGSRGDSPLAVLSDKTV
jgi:hypothetical protein